MTQSSTALYGSIGPLLTRYEIDPAACTLAESVSVTLPARVQYAWPHVSGRFLYVASSDGGPGAPGSSHWLSALALDGAGGPALHGASVRLPARPIHITLDIPSEHALVSYNNPSSLTVHRLRSDATIGEQVPAPDLDTGIYAHQIRVAPSNRFAILVTRGNDAMQNKAEDPGALKVFDYAGGRLTNKASIAPNGGFGFGPRHVDFHLTKPWLFVSLERQNQLQLYAAEDDTLQPDPLFTVNVLADRGHHGHDQRAGTLHLHPNGRGLYVANRAHATTDFAGRQVFAGGENNLAVFALDARSGEPKLIQHADTHGLAPRTFALDPSGRMLVAANHVGLDVREGASARHVPASLAVFRVADDGTLDYVRKYDVDVGNASMFWMGIV
jgi:6-phosphogluconolactonase